MPAAAYFRCHLSPDRFSAPDVRRLRHTQSPDTLFISLLLPPRSVTLPMRQKVAYTTDVNAAIQRSRKRRGVSRPRGSTVCDVCAHAMTSALQRARGKRRVPPKRRDMLPATIRSSTSLVPRASCAARRACRMRRCRVAAHAAVRGAAASAPHIRSAGEKVPF